MCYIPRTLVLLHLTAGFKIRSCNLWGTIEMDEALNAPGKYPIAAHIGGPWGLCPAEARLLIDGSQLKARQVGTGPQLSVQRGNEAGARSKVNRGFSGLALRLSHQDEAVCTFSSPSFHNFASLNVAICVFWIRYELKLHRRPRSLCAIYVTTK